MSYTLRLFGLPALLGADGVAQSLRTRKHVALLVYLVLDGVDRSTPREHLIELFWPDVPSSKGRHSLAQALSAIRRQLGAAALHRLGRTVVFVGRVPTDLEALEDDGKVPVELQHPLRGLDHLAGPSFEHWLDSTRERLRRRARDALTRQLEIARSNGDGAAVHERAVHLYRADPLSDTAVQALCERMLNDGDAATAAALVRRHIQRLREDAGVQPPSGLRRLLHLMERGHLATRRVDRSAPRASSYRPPEVFVGRAPQLSRLERQWTDVPTAGRRACLVVGTAGMGKSSLLSRFSTSVASRSAIVWEVKSQEIGRNIPFATVSDFILALAQYPGAGETDARWLAEASRVAPGLRAWHSGIPDPPPVPADAVRLRVAEALVRIIQVVGDPGPMLLVLDDLEFLDPASRDILHLLLRRLERSSLLVVGSARSAGDQALVHAELDGSRGLSWDDVVTLGPLASEHVREMVARLCGPGPVPEPAILDTMVELAQGNPYLVEMLLSDWRRQSEESLVSVYRRGADAASRWRPPATMNKAFERQHRGLSAESDRVLSLLAVAGRRLPAREVGELLALDGAVADAAAMQLLDRGIVRVEEGGLQIKNQLHRSYVYHAMAEDTRRYLHGKVADVLAEAAEEGFQDLLEAAHHYVRSADKTRAADTLVVGAETAINRGAPKEAARAIEDVGAETGDCRRSDLTLLLAEAFLWQGLHVQAVKQIQVIRTMTTDLSVRARAKAVGAEAMYRGRLAANAEIGDQAKAALSLAEQANDANLVVRALQLIAEIAHDAADQATIDNVQSTACSIELTAQSREVLPVAAATQGYCMMISGHHREAADRFSESVRGLRQQRRETELRRALNGLGICLTNIGDLSQATAAFEDALRLAEQAGDPYAQSILWDNLAVIHEDMGKLVDAVDARRRAYKLSLESPSPKRHCEILTNAALLAAMLGESRQASSYLMESTELARTLGIPGLLITSLVACCDLALTNGEVDSAWRWAKEAVELAKLSGGAWRPIGDFTRIQLHYTWATMGYSAYREVRETTQARGLSFRLTHQLELEAFHEWVQQKEGAGPSTSKVVPKLAATQLYGSILRLASVGICPNGPVSTDQRIPSELRVRSAFPSCQLRLPTAPVDVLQRGA
ncbi:MAG: hypothetical protein AMS20_03830 [Gemmatimonas sp. SG8_28]|nr:MAG: hypothetical protein AMS20_03830 [Gemmatimonas sp. SG8_28]